MHLEAVIERDWGSTWRRSSWRRQFGREAVVREGGVTGAETLFVG